MNKKHLFLLLNLLLQLLPFSLVAQIAMYSYTLNSPQAGNKAYLASEFIALKSGFSYKAVAGESFTAKINNNLLLPPTDGTYQKSDGSGSSNPSDGGVVGAIPGQFDVSPSGGSTYGIPIDIPSGINGMQPNISLVYSSQSGNGIAGWGWNIGGISSISRVGSNNYNDSKIRGVQLTNEDNLSLDGQRLILVSGGNLGEGAKYRTEQDIYSDIKLATVNGLLSFEVKTKAGITLFYGRSSDSFIEASGTSKGLIWLLTKTIDANGNYMTYSYNEDNIKGEFSLSKINYTGNDNAGASPSNEINFVYTAREDITTSYISTAKTSQSVVLKSIISKTNGQTLREYGLEYVNDRFYTKLSKLTLKGADGTTYNPTIIDWTKLGSTGVPTMAMSTTVSADLKSGSTLDNSAIIIDLNNDGYSDFIKPLLDPIGSYHAWEVSISGNSGANFTTTTTEWNDQSDNPNAHTYYSFSGTYKLIPADINKDGITDLVEIRGSHGSYDVPTEYKVDLIFTNNGVLTRQKLDFTIDNSAGDRRDVNFSVGDYDGDGNAEFLAIYGSKITMYRFDLVAATKTLTVVCTTDISTNNYEGFLNTDINGNGKPELFSAEKGIVYEFDNTDSKFKVLDIKDGINSADKDYLVGDFNGDGQTDIVIYNHDNAPNRWNAKLSTGNAFIDITCPLTRIKTGDTSEHYSINDYNGDGRADILEIYSDPYAYQKYVVNVYYFNGTKFIKATHSIDDYNSAFYDNREIPYADINGDGKCDLVAIGYKNAKIYSFSTIETERRVTSITNGLKQKTEITYKPISDNTVYTAGLSDAPHNVRDICIPLQVVSEVNAGNSALTVNVKYSYKGLKLHTQGKGILGFEEFTTKNVTQGFTTVSKYGYNNIFFNTFPVEKLVATNKGNLVSTTKFENGTISLGNKRIFTYISKQTDLDNLSGLSTVTETYSFDGYGNPQLIIITKGIIRQSKSIKYGAFGAWCANKLKSITITNSNEVGSQARTTNYEYDSKGNVTKEDVDPGNVNESITNYSNYDKFGNPQLITTTANSKSLSTALQYSPSGRFVVSKTDNLGKIETYQYNEALGLKTSSTNEIGTSTFEYDGFGRIKHVVSADKTESVSALQWSTSVSGAVFYKYEATSGSSPITTWYDGLAREIREDSYSLNRKMISVATEYDNTGKLSKVSEPFFGGGSATNKKVYSYDDYGRLTGLATIVGSTSYVYDGLKATITAPSETTITTINSAGQTTSTSINGKKVSFTYWPSGKVKSATPEGGNAVTTTFDLQGNRTEMVDPDNGVISSNFNGIGQLLWEEQRKSSNLPAFSRTDYTYLDNGLLDNKQITGTSSEVTQYKYDSQSRVISVEIANCHKQVFAYDNLNRVTQTTETIGTDKSFTSQTVYDGFGRVVQEIFPSGYSTTNGFDKFGLLVNVSDKNGKIIWEAKEANARGQLTKVLQGGRESIIDYDVRGLPLSITSPNILSMAYLFNAKGNLEKRTDNLTAQSEIFGYDNLNRLTTWDVAKNGNVVKNNSISYDPVLGNVTAKSDIGYTMNYGEGSQPKHALTSIEGVPASLVNSSNLKTSFTNFNKVSVIEEGADTLSVFYGVGQHRIKGVFKTNNTTTLTRYYHGNYEEEVSPSGNIRKIHYISGGNGLAAIFVQNGGRDSLYYTYTDYQGNLLAVTNEAGTVVQKLAYDPWGARRNPDDWTQRDSRKSFIFARGYTMHEHLDQFGLINMNGRIYDPFLAMFLSPDPYLQSPDNWLNHNRYSYCLNNPLRYNDPSGYNWASNTWGHVVDWCKDNKTAVVTTVAVVASAIVIVATWGVGTPLVAACWAGAAGATGAFSAAVLGTALDGGSWQDCLTAGAIQGTIGFVAGFVGAGVGTYAASEGLGIVISGTKITSPVINGAIGGLIGGGAGGYVSAFAGTFIGSLADGNSLGAAWDAGTSAGINGAITGMVVGLVSGTVGGIKYAKTNKIGLWDGKPISGSVEVKASTPDLKYAAKVRTRALEDPLAHNFPYSYDDLILSTDPIPKSNGYNMYEMPGTLNGKDGIFQIGVTSDGIIDHRVFRSR